VELRFVLSTVGEVVVLAGTRWLLDLEMKDQASTALYFVPDDLP
jgi:hypothetical protein